MLTTHRFVRWSNSPLRVLAVFAALALPFFAHAAPASRPTTRPSAAGRWSEGTLKDALRLTQGKRPILMQVHAHWCAPCNQLTYEVIDTPAGRKLLRDAVGIRVDFETPAGREVTRRYAVLGLPTTLVLTAQGEEIGRVLGYPGRRAYLSAIQDALAGKKGFKAVEAQYKKSPKNPRYKLTYAQALLHKGKEAQAKALLTSLMVKGNPAASSAFRIWGRWLVRVKRDGVNGAQHFLRAIEFFKGTPRANGFRYWAAKGLQLQGKSKAALKLFDDWIQKQPNNRWAKFAKANFMVHHKYPAAQTEPLIREVMKTSPRNAWLSYMLAQVQEQKGDKKAAIATIRKALQLSPHSAIFKYYLQRLQGHAH